MVLLLLDCCCMLMSVCDVLNVLYCFRAVFLNFYVLTSLVRCVCMFVVFPMSFHIFLFFFTRFPYFPIGNHQVSWEPEGL